MKFLNLQIENIASLKGKHKIDFQDIENYTNVFAITGDTGSGKSTILNCLSLAFYGQNYKKSLNQMDFITLNEPKGSVSVQAQLDGAIYKFNWSCRLKKKNGEDLKNPKPKREFFIRNKGAWDPIEKTPEEIVKLSFDQFCKTIILNQGDFAKFLTSSFTDRKEILERFYEGINLDRISTVARQNLNAVKEQIALLESKRQGLTQSSDEGISKDDLNQEVTEKKKTNAQLESLSKNLKNNSQVLRDITKTQQTIEASNERLIKIKKDLEEITKEHNQRKVSLDQINKSAIEFDKKFKQKEPVFRAGIKKKEKIDQLEIQKERVRIEQKNAEETLKKIQIRLEETLNAIAKKEEERDVIKIEIKEISKEQARETETLLKENITKIQNLEIKKRDVLSLATTNDGTQKEAELIKKEIKGVDQNEVDSKIAILKNRIEQLNSTRDSLNETENGLKQLAMQYEDTKNQVSLYKKDMLKLSEEISRISNEIKKLEQDVENLNTSIKYYDLIEAIHECQDQTIKDGKCVVCNATNITNLPSIDMEGLEKRNDLKSQKEEKLLILNQLGKTSENTKGRLSTLDKEHSQKLNQYKDLGERKEALQKEHTTLLAKAQDLKNKSELEEKLETLRKTKNENEFNLKQIENLRSKYKETKTKIESLSSQVASDKKEIEGSIEKIQNLLGQKLEAKELLAQLEDLSQKRSISEQLLTLKKVEKSTNEEIDNLKEQQKQKKVFEAETLTEVDLLKNSIKSTCESDNPEQQLNLLNKEKDELSVEKDKIKEQFNKVEIQKADANSRFKNYTEQIDSSKDLINSTIVDLDFNLESDVVEKYQYNILSSLKKLKTYDQINFESLRETFQSLIDFEKMHDNIKKTNKDELIRAQTKLEQILEVEQKMGKIEKDLEVLLDQKNQLTDLYDIVGADQFRNFVLSNIEKNLIDQTNIELGKLCDERYQIVQFKKNAKSAPEFYIIDRYKAGLNRKITTLSGGETFMVSLAMALALSELTRGTREIDTLFIDEGFGTLDEESLEEVVEMLLSMSNRGKTVGLITHVKRLSERIAVNIHLEKSQQGNSTIDLRFQ